MERKIKDGKTKTTEHKNRFERKESTKRASTSKGNRKSENGKKELISKLYTKLTIGGIRIMPICISLAIVIATILSYWDLYYPVFDMFFGVSYISLLSLWILSKTYRFCLYHRMFIYHAATFNTVTWYNQVHPFNADDAQVVAGYLILSTAFFIAALWAHMKYGDRTV